MNSPQRVVSLLALAATIISASAVAKAALDLGNQSQAAKYLQLTSKVGGCQGYGNCGGGPGGGGECAGCGSS
jgi:hypothetical protein